MSARKPDRQLLSLVGSEPYAGLQILSDIFGLFGLLVLGAGVAAALFLSDALRWSGFAIGTSLFIAGLCFLISELIPLLVDVATNIRKLAHSPEVEIDEATEK